MQRVKVSLRLGFVGYWSFRTLVRSRLTMSSDGSDFRGAVRACVP